MLYYNHKAEKGENAMIFNARSKAKFCAFCKYWYDPMNTAIEPKCPQIGLWEFNGQAENKCLKCGANKKGRTPGCGNYICKLP